MTLRSKLIRLAHANPELRGQLLPLLKEAAGTIKWKKIPGGAAKAAANPGGGIYMVSTDDRFIISAHRWRTGEPGSRDYNVYFTAVDYAVPSQGKKFSTVPVQQGGREQDSSSTLDKMLLAVEKWAESHPIEGTTKEAAGPKKRNVDEEAIAKWAPASIRREQREVAQRDQYYHNLQTPGTAENERHQKILANQAEWEKLEGQWILRVPGQPVAALPTTGKQNAAQFVAFDLKTRKELALLSKREVFGWLTKMALLDT